MKVLERPTPNLSERPAGAVIDSLVLHYTGMTSGAAALARLTDPNAEVSAHYVVDVDGAIYRLASEAQRAWHAGLSVWGGREGLNDTSVGVEIVNPGHEWGLALFPEPQIEATIALCQGIVGRNAILPARVLAHSDIAPMRKLDPGEFFPWARFARNSVGLWPDQPGRARFGARPTVIEAQRMLAEWGYGIPESGVLCPLTQAVVAAFQRRYRPGRIDGVFDGECGALMAALLAAVRLERRTP